MTNHRFVEGDLKRVDGAPLCMECGESGSQHRLRSADGTCDWCGGRHHGAQCPGWDGR